MVFKKPMGVHGKVLKQRKGEVSFSFLFFSFSFMIDHVGFWSAKKRKKNFFVRKKGGFFSLFSSRVIEEFNPH